MVDYAMDIYRELHANEGEGKDEVPAEMEEQKAKVFEKLEALREGCRVLDELCTNEGEREKLMDSNQWNVEGLSNSSHGITPEIIDIYRQLAKFNYDCGDYQTSRDMLDMYLSLFAVSKNDQNTAEVEDDIDERYQKNKQQEDSTTDGTKGNPRMYNLATLTAKPELLEILWGKLSCEILLENWEAAGVALDAVKTGIEELASSPVPGSASTVPILKPLDALVQRTWLLHWGLFVFWNNNSATSQHGLEYMVDLFTTEKYLQAITTNAPHLLRYLTAAVLLSKRRRSAQASKTGSHKDGNRLMKELVKIMQHCEYTDPIVEFVDCLCVKFNFELAQQKLSECEMVLETDFFLCRQTALYMEEARVFVFENYCRIHHKIDLAALGNKLAMESDAAERWIVDLIRNALLDAKIDSAEGCVVMGSDTASVYEQVMERTRDLNLRTSTLATNLSGVLTEARKEKEKRQRAAMDEDF